MFGTSALPARVPALRPPTAGSTGGRLLRLSLLGAVVAPALLATTAAGADAKGPYPPAFNCPSTGATGGSAAPGATCRTPATTVPDQQVVQFAPSVPAPPSANRETGLAFTGADVLGPATLAGGLIAGGVLLSVGARRRGES